MKPTGLIPKKRLKWIPRHLRYAHELSYFFHDEMARILVEFETAKADVVEFRFPNKEIAKRFEEIAAAKDTIEAMRTTGFEKEARRVILNRITIAMVSDALHHIFEGLRCMERRKFIVAMNLFRKPLKDSMIFLAWMLGNEDDFYAKFSSGDPSQLSPKLTGNHRKRIFEAALEKTSIGDIITADQLIEVLYNPKSPVGLELYFQHAVHLIKVERVELHTTPENFNFIFKRPDSDDVYDVTYMWLPYILLFFSHIVIMLFSRLRELDPAGAAAFQLRTKGAYMLSLGGTPADFVRSTLEDVIRGDCDDCHTPITITMFNAGNVFLRERYRCPKCRRDSPLPLSWML